MNGLENNVSHRRPPRRADQSRGRRYASPFYFDCRALTLLTALASLFPSTLVARAQEPPPAPEKKKVEDLARKLIDKAASDSDEDLMASITRLMNDAAQRLEIRFDPGEDTQTVQRTILTKLDEAVKVAASQRRPVRSRPPAGSTDKRRMPKNRPEQRPGVKDARTAETADNPSAAQRNDPAKPGKTSGPGGELQETRRTWGHLPMRDREEIIQGIGEEFLERYRAWIERYYRALQESDE